MFGVHHVLGSYHQQLVFDSADFAQNSAHAVHLGFVGTGGNARIQFVIRHIACGQVTTQGDDRVDVLIHPALLGLPQSGQTTLLFGIIRCQALERIKFFSKAPLTRYQRLEKCVFRRDDEASHACLDVDQLLKSQLCVAQHLISVDVVVGGVFYLLEASVSTGYQHGNKYDYRDKTEIELLRDTEFAEHDVDPEHSRSVACMGVITRKNALNHFTRIISFGYYPFRPLAQ
ncbi:hypothetical protein ALP74_02661 [Pseudomonas coronafaciens pv. garcae]|uniref:Uncharacterized protein n=1 Tax=Pseudomonas coronafaciens pv. garcae TaxID=251653 RepID=A0AB37QJP4_9PSED|nr:hypothetical protein ALP74_02661 [Pseudomonas coronafaciens pv. garcae]